MALAVFRHSRKHVVISSVLFRLLRRFVFNALRVIIMHYRRI